MLVCSHCQFENPDGHKFCQSCGASLTDTECLTCGTSVPFNLEYCSQCGAVTGTTWKAILSPIEAEANLTAAQPDLAALCDSNAANAAAIPLPTGKFLDRHQRYQLLEPLPQQISQATEVEVRVLDHQPLQLSRLALDGLNKLEPLALDLEPNQSNVDPSAAAMAEVDDGALPEIAQLYLDLQEEFPGLPLPHLHDAWQQDGLNVLLLEDRSHLPLLVDLWLDENVLPLQILHWLHEMTELWSALEAHHCCRSLLELSNLRVDEDYLLCLQRLYPESPQQSVKLVELGHLWQKLFRQSQRTQNAALSRLCSEVDAGIISSLEQLRSRIEAIATALQSDQLPPPMTSAVPHPDEFKAASEPVSSTETTQDLRPVATTAMNPLSAADQDEIEMATATLEEETGSETDDSPTVVLAMRLVSLEDAGRTDIGRQRDHNEDCFSVQTEIKKIEGPQGRALQAKGLYILCDGMGGHASGEVASALAVETLQQYFAERWQDKLPTETEIREAIQQANRVLFDLNQRNASAGSGRMGTTLVLLLIHNTEAAIAHVGDSRLYRLSRRQGLQQLTVDHEVGQREIQRGVEPSLAYARPDAYQLTQALGPRDENFLNPDVKFFELNEDGALLLCSDGLSDNDLLESHWKSHLEPMLDQQLNLEQGVNQLIDLANHFNGHDNITAIAVRLKVRPNLDQVSR